MAMTVLVDVDGVLGDFRALFHMCAQEATGRDLPIELLSVGRAYSKQLGLSSKESAATWDIIKEPRAALRVPVLGGAVEGLKSIKSLKHVNLYIVSSPVPSPTWCYDRWQWLTEHFDIPRDNVIYTWNKQLVQGDVFVDDDSDNVRNWSLKNFGKDSILWEDRSSWTDLRMLIKLICTKGRT